MVSGRGGGELSVGGGRGTGSANLGGGRVPEGTSVPTPPPPTPPPPDPTVCSYSINPSTDTAAATLSTDTVAITTTSGCAWTVSDDSGWLSFSPTSGTGSGTTTWTAIANPTASVRVGTATIAGQTFTVTQAATEIPEPPTPTPCTYATQGNVSALSVTYNANSGTIGIQTQVACAWNAASDVAWITVSPSSGTGNGAIVYTVAANTGNQRVGRITIANGTLAVVITQIAQPVAPPPSPILTPSGSITVSANNATYEGLDITGNVTINGYVDVTFDSCRIRHASGHGIDHTNADRLTIQDVEIIHTGAPASGANPSSERNNINGDGSEDVRINRVRLTDGSSGIYHQNGCYGTWASFVHGTNFRGPFPRGQLCQFNRGNNSILEDFYCYMDPNVSWAEDNVNLYITPDFIVRRGLLDGNNSPSGIGVIVEGQAEGVTVSGGLVEDVDTIRMGNGSFSAYEIAHDITFRRCRARENINTSQAGRGAPLSNALMFASGPGSTGIRFENCSYYASVNGNIAWDQNAMVVAQFTLTNYTQRSPITVTFPWD